MMGARVFLLLVFCMHVSLQSTNQFSTSPWSKNKISFYGCCLLIKEFILSYVATPFWLDYKKIKYCNIYCNACEYKMNIVESIGHFACYARSDIVAELKKMLYQEHVDIICEYLVKINIQEEQECVRCHEYCGWHIKTLDDNQVMQG